MMSLVERLESKFVRDEVSGCWVWTASTRDGYGQIRLGSSVRGSHVVMWELVVGPVADGHELDHLCRNRRCVNPAHLEVVTHRENVLRGMAPAAVNARKRRCARGHDLTVAANVYRYGSRRSCRSCALDR